MVPNKDYFADKNGKLTDDPSQFAFQIAVAGAFLDDRTAKRYGIEDSLVSVDEPAAVRKVMTPKPEKETEPEQESEKETESEPKPLSIQSEADAKAAEPKAETKAATVKKAGAKKGAKKK